MIVFNYYSRKKFHISGKYAYLIGTDGNVYELVPEYNNWKYEKCQEYKENNI